jgi:uncharacterized protein (DUF2249 family)
MTTLQQPSESVVDARAIIPRERHPLIFNKFSSLKPGQSFVVINDHDPKPLYHQFQAEHENTVKWDYLKEGPYVWSVRIGRIA